VAGSLRVPAAPLRMTELSFVQLPIAQNGAQMKSRA
jgi:hypothetical protein